MPSRETRRQWAPRREQARSAQPERAEPESLESPTDPLRDGLDSGFGIDAFRRHAALLADPRLAHSANAGPRQAIAQNLQRQHGNSYVRRLVEHVSPTEAEAFEPKLTAGEAGQGDRPVRVQLTKVSVQREFAKVKDDPGIDLDAEESSGGHTIARHVGKEQDYITGRITGDGVDTASTYPDKTSAQQTVNATLKANKSAANEFIFDPTIGVNTTKAFRQTHGDNVGAYLSEGNVQDKKGRPRKDKAMKQTKKAVAILRKSANGAFLLTSFPEP